jgi:hypothetical protein
MALKDELTAMLTGDRKRLEQLQKQIESLMQERADLQKAIRSEETLLDRKFGIQFTEGNKDVSRPESIEKRFEYKTIPQGAFEIILEGGNKPIHLKDIFRMLTEGGKEISQPSSISVALRRDKRFKLIGPNVFAIGEEEYRKAKEESK